MVVVFAVACLLLILWLVSEPLTRTACFNLVALEMFHARTWRGNNLATLSRPEAERGAALYCAPRATTALTTRDSRILFWAHLLSGHIDPSIQDALVLVSRPDRRETDLAFALLLTDASSVGEIPERVYSTLNEAQLLFYLARALDARGDVDWAGRFYLKAGLLAPANTLLIQQIASWFNQRARYQDALQVLYPALESHPTDLALQLQLAHALIGTGQAKRARGLLEGLVQNDASATGYLLLGQAYYEDKDWSAAANAYLRALELEPQNLWAMHGLGRTLEKQNKKQEAKLWWQRALTLDPQFQPAKDALSIH